MKRRSSWRQGLGFIVAALAQIGKIKRWITTHRWTLVRDYKYRRVLRRRGASVPMNLATWYNALLPMFNKALLQVIQHPVTRFFRRRYVCGYRSRGCMEIEQATRTTPHRTILTRSSESGGNNSVLWSWWPIGPSSTLGSVLSPPHKQSTLYSSLTLLLGRCSMRAQAAGQKLTLLVR